MDQTKTIDEETQKRLNTPLQKSGSLEPEDDAFLKDVIAKTEKGSINLFTPSSLLNKPVYEKLPNEKKAVVETEAFTTLAALREIVNLWRTYQTSTFQLQNLIHKVRLSKERFEKDIGDVFVI